MSFHDRFKYLAIFHYVVAGVTALMGCFPLIHVTVGTLMVSGAMGPARPGEPSPEFIGLIFIAVGTTISLLLWATAATIAAGGYFLHSQRHYTFCLVVAATETMIMPFGTVLGVLTIITLVDARGKAMFERTEPSTAEELSQ